MTETEIILAIFLAMFGFFIGRADMWLTVRKFIKARPDLRDAWNLAKYEDDREKNKRVSKPL